MRGTGAARRKLPIGIQTFREIREEDCYYVDKTAYALRLIDEGKHYFLSRPRRFGKSLFLDTLKELFEGSEALFEGLAAHGRWDWSVRHPVVRLDFSAGDFTDPRCLPDETTAQLAAIEKRAGVEPGHARASIRFRQLVEALHDRGGRRVAVLVDEYDKPILDALAVPEVARANRGYLRGLYEIARYEGYYASVVYSCFAGQGFDLVAEDSGSRGRADLALRFDGSVYLFEFKTVARGPEGAALAQLREKRRSTTRSTSCCSSASASSGRTGSRRARRPS